MKSTFERERLIAEVLAFVRTASRLPGIKCLALIGSLTTEKADPKDADLLVTVTDDADLAPLAALSRKLQGHAQSMNKGTGNITTPHLLSLLTISPIHIKVIPLTLL